VKKIFSLKVDKNKKTDKTNFGVKANEHQHEFE